MGKFSKIIKGLLAAAFSVMLILTMLPRTALAVSGSTIDRTAAGTLSIDLKYSGSSLAGGVFDLYQAATIDDSGVLSYTLMNGFEAAVTNDGLDINAVKTASELESAASTLAKYTSGGAIKAATLTTTSAGPVSQSGLELGVYLVVQTGTPSYYSTANPFLVYIPMTNAEGTGWVYEYTAYPKTVYNPPFSNTVDVKVIKIWDDGGFESERPDSVEASLYRDGVLYNTQTLNESKNWTHIWTGLSVDHTWTVSEDNVPENYTCFIENSGNNWTLTNSRGDVPLSTTLNVTKEWSGDDPDVRPDSIFVTLLRDGEEYETVELTADGDWTYSWAGLEQGRTWSVTEPDVPDGYTSSVEAVNGGFLIKNTYGTDIPDEDVPKADVPQTGLVQWPIPVLLSLGTLLIAYGVFVSRSKKKKDGR